jgi:chromosome segregation ATPase
VRRNKIIANDPFKIEINKLNLTIKNLEAEIQHIKKTTEINAQKNKEYCTNLKNKLVNVRFEIKNEIDTLEKLEREYINQELKYVDDKKNKQNKIKEIEAELNEHTQYLEGLITQNDNNNQLAKEIYNVTTLDFDNKIKSINYEINHLKYQSNNILKAKDEYIRKRNQIGNDKKRKLDDINKGKIRLNQEIKKIEEEKNKWRNEFIKYNNRCDYLDNQENTLKINTLTEIQELYKSRNNAELELNSNYFTQS